MLGWFERMNIDKAIYVLKYDMYQIDGHFVTEDIEGATKFTDCHGWYEREEDAIFAMNALNMFSGYEAYRMEKVYKREVTK